MVLRATIQINLAGQWQDAATVSPVDISQGHVGASVLEYLPHYALAHIGQSEDAAGVSCRYPANFDYYDLLTWPPLLLDLLPNGAGRERWLTQLLIADGLSADWPLLLHACANPPGNLRIKEAAENRRKLHTLPQADGRQVAITHHAGFSQQDIVDKQEHFIEYAYQHGAFAAGASDVQGVAPKFLMVVDSLGRWHAQGALEETQEHAHYIVKFPRGKSTADKQVLKNEAAYMQVAKALGISVHGPLVWRQNTLFIPRFDRPVGAQNQLQYLGMESLGSLAGVGLYGSEYGGAPNHGDLVAALANYSTQPTADVLEYIKRDVLNIMLGNKDNHARNSAVLKSFHATKAKVCLSPLFDFAPMYLDPEIIPRACRWPGDQETGGQPNWVSVVNNMPPLVDKNAVRQGLLNWLPILQTTAAVMVGCGVDESIVTYCKPAIKRQITALGSLSDA